jgi:hypothetical protein
MLAGFNSTATQLFIRSQPINVFATATWFSNNATVTTPVRLPIEAGKTVQINLYGQTPWLSLPKEGIRVVHGLTVSTNAVDGPVPPTLIPNVPAVGSFNDNSSITFSVAQAGLATNVTLAFTAAMPLLVGDIVTVALPDFTVEPTVVLLLNSTINLTATSDSLLTFRLLESIEAGVSLTLNLSSVNIKLPIRGVDNQRCCSAAAPTCCIYISSNAARGPVARTPVTFVPVVGAILDTELQFDPLLAGASVNMTILFTPTMVIQRGEIMTAKLPGLSSNASQMLAYVEQIPAPNQAKVTSVALAQWMQDNSTLIINFTRSLTRYGPVSMLMGSLFDIPATGVMANNKDFTLSLNAASGPVPPTSILISPGAFGAGNFTNSTISLSPLLAGSVTDVTVSFAATMTLIPGTTVELRLDGFLGPAQPVTIVLDSFWRALVSSNPTGVVMKLVTNSTIRAETAVSLTISGALAQISIPIAGLPANSGGVTISTNALSGPVLPTPFQFSPAVGSFLSSPTLSFVQARASEACNMVFSFTPQMTMVPGELITLGLGRFTGPNSTFNVVNVTSSDRNASAVLQSASWNEGVLVLTVNSVIMPRTNVILTIPSSSGILLPAKGIVVNSTDITIATNAVAGPVPPVAVSSTQAVGSFDGTTSITFLPAKAGQVTEVNIEFSPMMDLRQAEGFQVTLPGFRLINGNDTIIPSVQLPVRISWTTSDAQSKTSWLDMSATYANDITVLRFTCTEALARLELYRVRIPRPVGIKIPDEGVVGNASSYIIESWAVAGPVLPTRVARTQAIGSFISQSLYFTEMIRAGTATAVKLSWMSRMQVGAGETVSVFLPGFVASQPIINLPLTESAYYSSVSWSASSQLLSFTATSTIPALTAQLAELPPSAGLLMSTVGVSYATTLFEISSDAMAGPVPGTTIHEVQVVGSYQSTALSFSPAARAGDPSRITVSVSPRMLMRAGETIEIALPGFRCDVVNVEQIFWNPSLAYNLGIWDAARTTLSMTLPLDVIAGSVVTASVSSTVGIRTPLVGVRTDQVTLTLAASAVQGPVPPTSIEKTQAVGSFGGTPRLVYSPESGGGRANTTASILASFVPQMRLSPNDRISFYLPSFQGKSSGTVVVESSNVAPQTFSAVWSFDTRTASLIVMKEVPRLTEVMVLLPVGMGIRLPGMGIEANSPTLTISSTAVDGPVPQTPIPISPGIGFLRDLAISFNQYCTMSAPTIVDFTTTFSSARTPLAANEVVTVSLPGFSASDMTFDVTSTPAGKIVSGSWTASASSVSFTVAERIDSSMLVQVTVPSTVGVVAPAIGVSSNQASLRISSNSNGAPVSPTPFAFVGAIGIISDSSITFTETCQGMPTSLTATVRASIPLFAGDNITLSLLDNWPRGGDAVTIAGTGAISSIQWKPDNADGSQQIILTVARNVLAGQEFNSGLINIQALSLPGSVGDPTKLSPSVSVSLKAAQSKACAVMVSRFNDMTCNPSNTVMIFNSSSLEYTTNLTTVPAGVTVRFTVMQPVKSGVSFVVSLPGFRLPAGSAGTSNGFATVTPKILEPTLAIQASGKGVDLSLKLSANMPAGTSVLATIVQASNLLLPEMGTSRNQEDFKITVKQLVLETFPWFGAKDYSVAIASSPAVGVILGSSLSFTQRAAGAAVDMLLSFKFTLALARGDVIELFLDGFGGAQTASVSSVQGGVTMRGSWTASRSVLSMTVDSPTITVQPNTQVSVSIPSSSGIKLPTTGVRANQQSLLISMNLASTSVPYIPIQTTPVVFPYRCIASYALVSEGAMCDGNHTVRVCALSQGDADSYANYVALPALRQVTQSSCEAQGNAYCSAAGGTFGGATQGACCRTVGAGDLGQCTVDSDCIGADNGAPTATGTKVPVVESQCCDFCAKDAKDGLCRNGNSDTACNGKCTSAKPCYGYAVSFVKVEINPAEGGAVTNALGLGFKVPPGVWPPEAGPATMVFTAVPDTQPTIAGASFAGGAVTFGPSPMMFPEPGVTMVLPYVDDGDPTTVVRAFKLVDGEWVMQPFMPVIDPATGTVSVKTLSFSTYILMAVPITYFTPSTPAPTPSPTPPPPEPVEIVVPPTPKPTPLSSGSGGSAIGPIVGAVVGGGVVLLLIAVAIFLYRRHRQRQKDDLVRSAVSPYHERLTNEQDYPVKPIIMEVRVCLSVCLSVCLFLCVLACALCVR